jgi:type 1 glutamine amidotransferase
MKKSSLLTAVLCAAAMLSARPSLGREPRFKALALYTRNAEPDHVLFAENAIQFFSRLAAKDDFSFDASSNWNDLNAGELKKFQLVIWLNDSPKKADQRKAFEDYMTTGGSWMGFHASAYNDASTQWPWFVDFLGGSVFYANSWPPLPARLHVDDTHDAVTKGVPETFTSPSNEWYLWKPSPRLNKNVRVLVTLDASNYPLGFKDVLLGGDVPVVWTNTKYRMVYMNMGHGDKIFTDPVQNRMIENAAIWLGTK